VTQIVNIDGPFERGATRGEFVPYVDHSDLLPTERKGATRVSAAPESSAVQHARWME